MTQEKILLCGLPNSGKTTYLAALWYLLFQEEIATTLSLGALPENRDYLNKLSSKWSRCIQIEHTPTDELQEISLSLINDSAEVDLSVPDMSGETWESVWTSRTCTRRAAEWAQEASGIMLFTHADKIRQSIDIETRNAMMGSADEPTADTDEVPWSPERTPTQVVLVDVIQALTLPPLGTSGRKLAVIVSAWDKAIDTGLAPDEYLRTYFPLFHQFLFCSGLFSEVKIFGVSALGGDLELEEEAERLKSENIPSNRIKVVEENKTHHDLTIPIQWLMDR